MENSLKGQMVEPLCTRTVKFGQVEMMLWVAKLQLAWCLQGPRGFSTTTAPDGIVHHQSAARAVPTGLVSYPLRKLHTRKKKVESIHQCWLGAGVRLKNLMSRRSRDASRIERWDSGGNLRWPRLWVVTATCEEATTTSSEKWQAGLPFLCCWTEVSGMLGFQTWTGGVRIFTPALTQSLFVVAK